jgi:uncharacterized membrane protein YkoI
MKFPFYPELSFCCLMFLASASADTVLLNNGQSVEGKILYEDETSYMLEIQVSKGIKDEKKILKSEIKSIAKQEPDIEEFAKLKGLVPVPDLVGVADYEIRIKKLNDFIKEFPKSAKFKEAREMQEALRVDMEVVRAGGIKFSGKMIKADDYLSNAYAYDESITAQKINREISNRNLLGALRLFADYETKFSEGNGRAELIPKIKQVLQIYKTNLSESLSGYDDRIKAREAGLERMTEDDRQKTKKALEDQAVDLKARFDREKSLLFTWITPDENHKESMMDALRQAEVEIKRLDTPPKTTLTVVLPKEEAYREAWNKLPGASLNDQKKILDNLKRDRMPEYYLEKLRARVTPKL